MIIASQYLCLRCDRLELDLDIVEQVAQSSGHTAWMMLRPSCHCSWWSPCGCHCSLSLSCSSSSCSCSWSSATVAAAAAGSSSRRDTRTMEVAHGSMEAVQRGISLPRWSRLYCRASRLLEAMMITLSVEVGCSRESKRMPARNHPLRKPSSGRSKKRRQTCLTAHYL